MDNLSLLNSLGFKIMLRIKKDIYWKRNSLLLAVYIKIDYTCRSASTRFLHYVGTS